jgi:hypothetical protein
MIKEINYQTSWKKTIAGNVLVNEDFYDGRGVVLTG